MFYTGPDVGKVTVNKGGMQIEFDLQNESVIEFGFGYRVPIIATAVVEKQLQVVTFRGVQGDDTGVPLKMW